MSTGSSKPLEELDINKNKTRYDPEMIQELFGKRLDESSEFEVFKEEETRYPENHLIADRIKVVIKECKVENKQSPNIREES